MHISDECIAVVTQALADSLRPGWAAEGADIFSTPLVILYLSITINYSSLRHNVPLSPHYKSMIEPKIRLHLFTVARVHFSFTPLSCGSLAQKKHALPRTSRKFDNLPSFSHLKLKRECTLITTSHACTRTGAYYTPVSLYIHIA